MADWIIKLDGFLALNDRDILTTAGRISHELAANKAKTEYQEFASSEAETHVSDFDKFIGTVERKGLEESRDNG
jgi:hypothetical protein